MIFMPNALIYMMVTCLLMGLLNGDAYARSVSTKAMDSSLMVSQHLGAAEDGEAAFVLLAGGRAAGVVEGSLFETFRPGFETGQSGQPLYIRTGRLKALEVHEDSTLALIIDEGGHLARRAFDRFAGVMVGDRAVEQRQQLVVQQALTPTLSLTFDELFIDSKRMPANFELSAEGRQRLRQAAAELGHLRLQQLLVEGHTDDQGGIDANQLESYQRALTIRHFLVSELGFDPNRIVALGFGQSEPLDLHRVPGYQVDHRRIVLKAIDL